MSSQAWNAEIMCRRLGEITKEGVSEILFSMSPSPMQAYLIESSAAAAASQVEQAFRQALDSAIQIQNMANSVDGMSDMLLLQAQQQQQQALHRHQAQQQQAQAQQAQAQQLQQDLLLLKTRQLQLSQGQQQGQQQGQPGQGPGSNGQIVGGSTSAAANGIRFGRQDSSETNITPVASSGFLAGQSSKDCASMPASSDGTGSIMGDLLYQYSNESNILPGRPGSSNTRLIRSSTGDLPRRNGVPGAGGPMGDQPDLLLRSRTHDLGSSGNNMGPGFDSGSPSDLNSYLGKAGPPQQYIPALLQGGGLGMWQQQQQQLLQQQQQQFQPQQWLMQGMGGQATFTQGPSAQAYMLGNSSLGVGAFGALAQAPVTPIEDLSQLPTRFAVLPAVVQMRVIKLCLDNPILTIKDFDKKVVDKMATLVEGYSAPECLAMIDELEHRMRTKHAVMKNGPGYLDVAVSSHLDMLRAQGKSAAAAAAAVPVGNIQEYAQHTLSAALYDELAAALETSRWLKWEHLDQGIIHMIKKLPSPLATEKLQELACHSFKNVNNTKGCIMSILNSKPNQPLGLQTLQQGLQLQLPVQMAPPPPPQPQAQPQPQPQ